MAVEQKAPFQIGHSGGTFRYLNALIYAPPGTGKTVLASTAQDVPDMQNVLFLDVEAGSMSISNREDIDVIRINSYEQFGRVYEFLRLHCRFRDAGETEKLAKLNQHYGADPDKVYHTVVIDSLTEVQKQLMYMLLGTDISTADLNSIPKQAQFAEWGQNAEMIRMLVRTFRDLPMHCIVVCAEAEYEDEQKRRIKRPNLPGKLAGEIQGFFDVVGYLQARRGGENNELYRRLYITPGVKFQAKHRFGDIDVEHIDQPEMADLWELVKPHES